jgi:hypothetical protein
MAGLGSSLLDTPSSPKKRKWTDTALTVFLCLIVAFFLLSVASNSFQLFFQHSLFGK